MHTQNDTFYQFVDQDCINVQKDTEKMTSEEELNASSYVALLCFCLSALLEPLQELCCSYLIKKTL